jgi:hypothetical protein
LRKSTARKPQIVDEADWRFGHNLSVTDFPELPLQSPLLSETCRMAYERYSAEAVVHESTRIRPQWIGYRSLGRNLIERRISELLTGSKRH